EHLKQRLELGVGNADAGVAHPDLEAAVRVVARRRNPVKKNGNGAARCEFDPVIDQVEENLAEPKRIAGDEQRSGDLGLEAQIDFSFEGAGAEEPQDLVNGFDGRKRQALEDQAALLDFCKIENVVDERRKAPGLARDGGGI